MEVTDKMIEIACKAVFAEPISKFRRQEMKAALEAVFASILEKPDNSIFNSFPPELPIMPEDKPFCVGKSCKATKENLTHSRECLFEHFMAYTGYDEKIRDELQNAYFDGMDATYKLDKCGCKHKQLPNGNIRLSICSTHRDIVKPEKKTYKLSEMWKGWYYFKDRGIIQTPFFENKKEVADHTGMTTTLLAITRANATEFYEGEGLISEYLEGRCG